MCNKNLAEQENTWISVSNKENKRILKILQSVLVTRTLPLDSHFRSRKSIKSKNSSLRV